MKEIKLTKINRNILLTAVVWTTACGLFQSCKEDGFDEPVTNPDTLIESGRYLVAKRASSETRAEIPDLLLYKPTWFEPGTPYRLFAFSEPYSASTEGTGNAEKYLRFNEVAWEGRALTPDTIHYLNLENSPDKWFGFPAIEGEEGGSDGRVSLDFYGFTYGSNKDDRNNYIPTMLRANTSTPKFDTSTPTAGQKIDPANVWYSEPVKEDPDELADLMWGQCLNCNFNNVKNYGQSIIPFSHCFSRLRFLVVHKTDNTDNTDNNTDNTDNTDNVVEVFPGIQVEEVYVTNTYKQAYVNLKNGKIELVGEAGDRKLNMSEYFTDTAKNTVTSKEVEMGQMIIYPTHEEALLNETTPATGETPSGAPSLLYPDGLTTGLKIKIRCKDQNTIQKFLANQTDEQTITKNDDGTYTIIKSTIFDNYYENENGENSTKIPLKFEQNTAYTLVISFQENSVRIITVIPQVEEWLPGEMEGTTEKPQPWQEQPMGQPQMFDNVYWSDRNLGANHYDPLGDHFEKTIGYFYQSGRNIPYYPFDVNEYGPSQTYPSWKDLDKSVLADVKPYNSTSHKFYPIIDEKLLKMKKQTDENFTPITNKGIKDANDLWVISSNDTPVLYVPEEMPTDKRYFDFMKGDAGSSGLSKANADIHWDNPSRQPIAGGWTIPSVADFMGIFPATPHAGNICFRGGGYNNNPMNSWGQDDLQKTEDGKQINTLRVTVPYYTPEMEWSDGDGHTKDYKVAWDTLQKHSDPGTTHLNAYVSDKGPHTKDNIKNEPEGDPEAGYASVYVLSREPGSIGKLTEGYYPNNYVVKEWGTIYAIKRVYTPQAYRMRWRVICAGLYGTGIKYENKTYKSPGLYIEICRYRCTARDTLTEDSYMKYDWDHPAATIYFPICGLGDHDGFYINFGTECQYAVSDAASDWKVPGVQIKISGDNYANTFMSVIDKPVFNRDFGKQIRPVMH